MKGTTTHDRAPADIRDALAAELGADTLAYTKSSQLARRLDEKNARQVGHWLAAIANGEVSPPGGITVEMWSASDGSGAGYTWALRRDDGGEES